MATTRKTRATKNAVAASAVLDDTEVSLPVREEAASEPAVKTEAAQRELKPDSYVTVRNGFNGRLVYKTRKTGERFVWEDFGAEQDMEIQELKNAKNSYKSFFEENWFMLDPDVIAYLGVERYYKDALTIDGMDALFNMDADEVKKKVSRLSNGQKATIAYRAKQMIRDKQIDSLRVIGALEASLGIQLMDRP